MNGIPERIVDGGNIQIDVLLVPPDVGHGKRDIVGERSRPRYTHSHRVRAQVAAARQTVAAPAADHVSLAGHNVAAMKIAHI